jgi:hypothetical protein
MLSNTWDYWGFELCPLYGILKNIYLEKLNLLLSSAKGICRMKLTGKCAL